MVKGVDGISAMIKECTVKEPKKRPDFAKLESRIREIEARVAEQPAISRTQSLKPGMRSGSSGEARAKQTTPLATKNLLEDTDGLRRPPSIHSKGGDAIHQWPLDAVALCFC